ncbi:metal ABC transporter permease [Corynebacterium sp. 32222D000AT]|uniref:metal ABC transporter permease n=1 Tax=unclassified Corynebacterium TaxID=2624378 RepID=UPI002A947684|nr:metal ABC transporter permease [Mycobacteriaceae bacterium]MDY5828867.1 metal ABC transporter permease [Corynebacterium sp.]
MNPLDLLDNYTYTQALVGTVGLGVCAGALGPLIYLRRQSLLADAISHSALPGLLVAFLAATMLGLNGRNPLALVVGSVLSGVLAVAIINALVRHTPLRPDAAMAATLTTFFSLGMLLMQYISRHPLPGKAGIQDYLLGNASTLTRADVSLILVIGVGTLLILSWVHDKQSAVVFDVSFAQVAGLAVRVLDWLSFLALTVVTVSGVKVSGVVLMVAVVIAPAAAARQWTTRLLPFIALSAAFGGLAAAVGCYISIAYGPLPTGPVIVLVQAALVAVSFARTGLSRRQEVRA